MANNVVPYRGFTLLWENPDPTASFAAQTIAIDLTGYDAVIGVFCSSTSSAAVVAQGFAFKSESTLFRYPSYSSSNMRFYARTFDVSNTGVSVSAGTYRTQGSSSETTANDRMLPVRIYGIKFG